MELIEIIIACAIASIGFLIGKFIQGFAKEEVKKGSKIIKIIQDVIYGVILVFLFMIFDINLIISLFLATAITIFSLVKTKKPKIIRILIMAITLASTFKTKFFLIISGTIFIYALMNGMIEKNWKDVIKKTALLLILSLLLIYLRKI